LTQIAEAFSPRYERHGDHLVTIDIRGLDRLLGSPRTIGEELRRDAADRGIRAHIAIARTRTAARVLATSSPGLTVVDSGQEATALAPIAIGILEKLDHDDQPQRSPSAQRSSKASGFGRPASARGRLELEVWPPPRLGASASLAEARQKQRASEGGSLEPVLSVLKSWGIRTLGEFAALPSADLAARLGRRGLAWQSLARGEDTRPLVPARAEERFDATLELEWPIEGLEPLSFVL